MQKRQVGEWLFYVIPAGMKVYRGDTGAYLNNLSLRDLEYFSDHKTASTYGLVCEYTAKDDIFLIAMDDIDNVAQLYEMAPDDVRVAITSSFGYSPRRKKIIRDSDDEMDKRIAHFVCRSELQGYAHEKIKSDTEADFHPEMAICHPNEVLGRKKKMPYSQQELDAAEWEHKYVNINVADKKQRVGRQKESDDEDKPRLDMKPKTLFFGDD